MSIPNYLYGKSAAQIVDEQRERFIAKSYNDVNERVTDRIHELEMFLLIAIKDALCNAEQKMSQVEMCDRGEGAEGRAIAFLNMVLPYKE